MSDWSKKLGKGERFITKEYKAPLARGRAGRVVGDEHLIRREFYNPNKFNVQFSRQNDMVAYIMDAGIDPGPPFKLLAHDSFLVLPHAYYVVTAMDAGAKHFDLHQNFGKSIGKGYKKPGRWG